MIELFIIQYVLVTVIAFLITEQIWSSNHKAIKFVGCMIPIYREIIILIILWQRNEIQKNKHV